MASENERSPEVGVESLIYEMRNLFIGLWVGACISLLIIAVNLRIKTRWNQIEATADMGGIIRDLTEANAHLSNTIGIQKETLGSLDRIQGYLTNDIRMPLTVRDRFKRFDELTELDWEILDRGWHESIGRREHPEHLRSYYQDTNCPGCRIMLTKTGVTLMNPEVPTKTVIQHSNTVWDYYRFDTNWPLEIERSR